MAGNDSPAVSVVGDEVHYRASSLGSCTRALAASRQELERWQGKIPEGVQKAFDKGHEAEDVAIADMRRLGWVVFDQQKEVTIQLTPKLKVVGHVDGIALQYQQQNLGSLPKQRLVEIKRQNDEEWGKSRIVDSMWWGKYQWQLSAYMIATSLPALIARINDDGKVKYETWLEPPRSRGEILGRVLEVEKMAREDLHTVECDKADFPCPYWKLLHPGKEIVGDVVEVDDSELASWVIHLARVNGDIREAEKAKKSLRDRIVERVKLGITRDRDTGVAVKVTQTETRQRTIPPGTMTRVDPILPDNGADRGDS